MPSQPAVPGRNVVFVHGAGSNADFWHEQRTAFLYAHYLDLLGHSSRGKQAESVGYGSIDGGCSVEMYADFVASYIEREELDGVVLNGHSMGGAIILTLALRQPGWLKAIVLTGTGARLRVLPRLLQLLQEDYSAAIDLILKESFAPLGDEPTYAQKARTNGAKRQLLRTPQEVTRCDYKACDLFDVMDSVSQIILPALCIVGTEDKMTPPKYSQYLHESIRGSNLEIVQGAGHMLPLEKPDEYNLRLGEFIKSLD